MNNVAAFYTSDAPPPFLSINNAPGSKLRTFDTLIDAVRAAIADLERVASWDGRVPMVLQVDDATGRPVFIAEHDGKRWTPSLSKRVLAYAKRAVERAR